MDLNELLHHHQMALMAVGRARREGQSVPNFDLPRYYAKRINEYRERRGLDGNAEAIAALVAPPVDPVDATDDLVSDVLIAELLMAKAFERANHDNPAAGGSDPRPFDIRATLLAVGRDFYGALGLENGQLAAAIDAASARSAWEGEGGGLRPPADEDEEEEGIVRTYAERYAVGGYRYSNLDDAKAAARRLRGATRGDQQAKLP